MYMNSYRIRSFIREVKKDWKKRAVKKGIAYLIFTSVFLFLLYLLLEYTLDVSPLIRGFEITAALAAILYLIVYRIIRPALRKYDDRQIALFIEEKIPGLEDRINSAVEVCSEPAGKNKDSIIDRLIQDAMTKTRLIDSSSVVDRGKERILSYISNAVLILFIIFLITFFKDISNLMGHLSVSFNPVSELNKEYMTIEPGNIQIEKGESQEILVTLNQETEDDVILHFAEGDDVRRKLNMEKSLKKPVFIHRFSDINEPITYYVECSNNKSDEYKISIYEFPKVTKIDLEYIYPDYTGIPPRIEENTGDIRGLKGSQVNITIQTSGTAGSANLVIDSTNSTALKKISENKFVTSLALNDSGYYHIDLEDSEKKHNKYPEEYQITPVNDEKPIIFVTEPQRDVRANLVEEVLVAVTVTDDYGIDDVNLKYSVNGEDEKVVQILDKEQKGEKDVSSSHLFYLEEFNLQPGDAISYYIEASDNFSGNTPEYSDMYFIEVTPLDTRYSQSRSRGGNMSGRGGNQSQTVNSQQEIISATWNLERKKNTMSENEFFVSAYAISKAQSDLRDNINSRLNSQQLSPGSLDDTGKKLIENLRSAVGEMTEAIKELEKPDLKKALKEERQALTYLLRAEALNDERRVQMQRGGGSAGGGANANDRISELMDLEMDMDKQKYETQQQQQMQQNREVDEALQKVKELARRQEKLAERTQRNLPVDEQKRELDRLTREQEKARQEAEDLTNQLRRMSRNNQQLSRQSQERMDRISQNMKKAEEALKNNNPREAVSHQQTALNELDELRQDLQVSQADNYRNMTRNFVQKFENLKKQEENFDKDLNQTYQDLRKNSRNSLDGTDIKRLSAKRKSNNEELQEIREQAKTIEEMTKKEDPDISTTLRNFQNSIEREQLEKNMEVSRRAVEDGWVAYARIKEYEIKDSIERLDSQIRRLEDKLPMTEEEELNRSLKDVRELLDKYNEISESLRERISRQNEEERNENRDVTRAEEDITGSENEDPENVRLQRQLDRMRETIENIRRSSGNNRNLQDAMQSLSSNLSKLHNIGVLLDEAGLEYFKKEVYNPLSQLEFQIVTRLDEVQMDKKLHGGRKALVPPQYRKIVEKYYESISKSNDKQKK